MVKKLFGLLQACAVVTLTACASAPNREVQFHEETGLTWASMDEAIVLARSAPQYALAARDYLYIGPVETNRLGEIEHFLWLGVASTVDRELRGGSAPEATTLVLLIDDTPAAFPLEAWEAEFAGSPYEVPVPVARARRVRVSLDQIRRIAGADAVEVHMVTGEGATTRYELWQGRWPSWLEFPAEPVGERLDARLGRR